MRQRKATTACLHLRKINRDLKVEFQILCCRKDLSLAEAIERLMQLVVSGEVSLEQQEEVNENACIPEMTI